jgi:hypothetical protein
MVINSLQFKAGMLSVLTLISAVSLIISGCTDPGSPETGTYSISNRLVVYQSAAAPPTDDPNDGVWDNALAGAISLGESGYPDDFSSPTKCFMKAIKTAERLYIRAEWTDLDRDVWPNRIVHYRDSTFDTVTVDPLVIDTVVSTSWTRSATYVEITTIDTTVTDDSTIIDTTVSSVRADQDRFAIIWDIGDNGDEGADCITMCHSSGHATSGDKMYTTGGGHVDVWQWLSANSDPLLLTRDEYWSDEGRQLDAGDSLAISNFDDAAGEPIYAHPDDVESSRPFLHSDSAIDFTLAKERASGYEMPGYVLNDNAEGSAIDVSGFSHYGVNTTRWVILMSRALSTGNSDDIDFTQVQSGDSVMVTIAIMDNADRLHSGSAPFYIVFP